jgi:hypothetical protein
LYVQVGRKSCDGQTSQHKKKMNRQALERQQQADNSQTVSSIKDKLNDIKVSERKVPQPQP